MSKPSFSSKKSYLKKSIPFFALGIGIIVLLAAATGFDKIVNAISQTDKRIYFLAFLAQISAIMVWLAKWKTLAGAIGLGVKTRRMLPILLSGIFVNTAVPSAKVGGEPLRAYMFSKIGEIPMDKSFASVAADRAVDGIPFLIILILSLGYILVEGCLSLYMTIILCLASFLVIIVVTAFIYFVFHPKPAKSVIYWFISKLEKIISKFRPIEYVKEKVEKVITGFGLRVREIFSNRNRLILALSLSFTYWLLSIFRMWLVFLALEEQVPFWALGIATIMGLVLHIIPIPGGLGIVESLYTLIFSTAGINPGLAFTAAMLDRGISFWFTSLFSAVGIAWSGLNLSRSWDS